MFRRTRSDPEGVNKKELENEIKIRKIRNHLNTFPRGVFNSAAKNNYMALLKTKNLNQVKASINKDAQDLTKAMLFKELKGLYNSYYTDKEIKDMVAQFKSTNSKKSVNSIRTKAYRKAYEKYYNSLLGNFANKIIATVGNMNKSPPCPVGGKAPGYSGAISRATLKRLPNLTGYAVKQGVSGGGFVLSKVRNLVTKGARAGGRAIGVIKNNDPRNMNWILKVQD